MRVSVVVPCLNRASFIERTVESVLNQDYPDIECVVIDGGSTDGTMTILEKYAGRIQVVSEPDSGHANAINKGWRMCTGEILTWLNADDGWIVPDAVRRAVGHLEAKPAADVIFGDSLALDQMGNAAYTMRCRPYDLRQALLDCDHIIYQPAAFIRRVALEKVGWLDEAFVSKKDHELWLRIALIGSLEYVPETFSFERVGDGMLADRGDVTADFCIALTRKFFTLPGVPNDLQRLRRRAFSSACLMGAHYAYGDGGHARRAWRLAVEGFVWDPTNLRGARRLAAWALSHAAAKDRRWLLLLVPARALFRAGRRIVMRGPDAAPHELPADPGHV